MLFCVHGAAKMCARTSASVAAVWHLAHGVLGNNGCAQGLDAVLCTTQTIVDYLPCIAARMILAATAGYE